MKYLPLILCLHFLACLPLSAFAGETARPKIVLALGGGGAARGAAHIGVLRVLERESIPVDCIVGTSMGAIVGGLYCAGTPLDRIVLMLHNKSLLHAYDTVPIPIRVALIPVFWAVDLFGKHPYDGLYRGNRFAHFIDQSVPPEQRQIENMSKTFWATASDLIEGKVFIVKSGDLGRAIQASAAIPFLRRPVQMQGKLLVDGGVLANVPSFEARQAGADILIAVDVDEGIEPAPPDKFKEFASVPNRSLSMILAKMDEARLKEADLVIQPDVSGMTLLSHSIKNADQAIAEGEKAAEMALPKIRALIAGFTGKQSRR